MSSVGAGSKKPLNWVTKMLTEEQNLCSEFIEKNSKHGLWLIHDNAYTANLTNLHAVESKRAEYPLMVNYRRVGGLSNVEWTLPLAAFLQKAKVGVCICEDTFNYLEFKTPGGKVVVPYIDHVPK